MMRRLLKSLGVKKTQRSSIMTDLTKLTNDELIAMENEIFNQWEKTERIHSLGDFSEIIREITLREQFEDGEKDDDALM